eukprot:scaffold1700_cov259-Pinguiococcus_pyrenoidosus.AAC.8
MSEFPFETVNHRCSRIHPSIRRFHLEEHCIISPPEASERLSSCVHELKTGAKSRAGPSAQILAGQGASGGKVPKVAGESMELGPRSR